MVEKTLGTIKTEDSPSITFCALAQGSDFGWKNKTTYRGFDTSAVLGGAGCGRIGSMDETIECVDEGTFNLTETVRSTQGINADELDKTTWIEEIRPAVEGMYLFLYYVQCVLFHYIAFWETKDSYL